MRNCQVQVIRWSDERLPAEAELRDILDSEGLVYYCWSNAPGDVYGVHTHSYDKVIFVAQGSITFALPHYGRDVRLSAGDRLELPAGVAHSAVVGPQGVACIEAHRQ